MVVMKEKMRRKCRNTFQNVIIIVVYQIQIARYIVGLLNLKAVTFSWFITSEDQTSNMSEM